MKGARTEGQVWEIINRERKRGIEEGIEMGEWKDYFKRQLEGVEWKMV